MRTRRYAKSRPQHTPGRMNKTENRFAQLLQARKAAGEIIDWSFEPLKLRLGIDWRHTYTPDFLIVHNDLTLELTDVKGGAGWEDDARAKIKSAVVALPWFLWTGHTERRRARGVFDCETFSPE